MENERKIKLFWNLVIESKVKLQDGDNIFVVEDELMENFYEMYNLTHLKMLKYPGLTDIIENHIVESISDLPGKNSELKTVFGTKYDYVPNISVDGIELTKEFDIIFKTKIKLHAIMLDGILLTDENKLKNFSSELNEKTSNFTLDLTPAIPNTKSSNNIILPILSYGEITEKGKNKQHNEDRFHTIDFAKIKIHIVMDGHGGEEVVNYLMKNINEFASLHQLVDSERKSSFTKEDAIKLFVNIDKSLSGFINVGSTCVIAVHNLITKEVYFINLGDSRALWKIEGNINIYHTKDQKPGNPEEKSRIEKLGGNVTIAGVPRINGKLAVSGSFGDYDLKPFVRNNPDVYGPYTLQSGSYYVLASDGLWDVLENQEVAKIIENNSAADAAYLLVRIAQNRKSLDDITVFVVKV